MYIYFVGFCLEEEGKGGMPPRMHTNESSSLSDIKFDKYKLSPLDTPSGKLSREKIFANCHKIRFSWRKLLRIAHWCHRQKMPCPPISQGKLSRIATKPQNL